MVKSLPVTVERGVTKSGTYRKEVQDAAEVATIKRIQSGDSSAYEPLWNQYWPWLCSFFRAQIGNREEAEDLAGATLLAAFEQLPRFRGQARPVDTSPAEMPPFAKTEPISDACTFKTYLGAIARNKMARYIQTHAKRRCRNFTEIEMRGDRQDEDGEQILDTIIDADVETNPLNLLLQCERLEEVSSALAYVGLRSNEQFKALLFHYMCGLPHKEVAEILDLRDETVNTRLQEGRRKLSRYFQAVKDEAATAVC